MKIFLSNMAFSQDLLGACAHEHLKTETVFPVGMNLPGHTDFKKEQLSYY